MDIRKTLWEHREALIILFLVLVIGVGFYTLSDVILPFLVSYVLAFLFIPIIHLIERLLGRFTRRKSELRSYAVTLFFIVGIVLTLTILIPATLGTVAQVQRLAHYLEQDEIDQYRSRAAEYFDTIKTKFDMFPHLEEVQSLLTDNREKAISLGGAALNGVGRLLGRVLNASADGLASSVGQLLNLTLIPLVLFYMLMDWERMVRSFYLLVPDSYEPWCREFLRKVERTLRDFVKGQFLICMIFGILMTVGLWLVGIPHALLLGPVAGLANMIPYMGVVVGLTPAIVLSFIQHGFTQATLFSLFGIAIVFTVINTIDGFILQPKITARLVSLHPLVVIIALVLSGKLMGVYGMLLAVPTVAVGRVLFEDGYARLYGRPWPFT